MFLKANPWDEAADTDRINEIRRDLELARRASTASVKLYPSIKSDLKKFSAALEAIQHHLSSNPDDHRRHRAIYIVDIPTIIETLEGAAGLPEGQARADLLALIPAAIARTCACSEALTQLRAEDLSLSLRVLPGQAPEVPEEVEDVSTGLMGRMKGLSQSAKRLVGDTVDTSIDAAGRVASTAGDVASAAGTVASLSGSHLASLAGSAGKTLTRPVSRRMQAMAGAVSETSLTALVLGGLTTLIFPPLAPFVAGEAILRMPEAYAAHLAGLSDEDARAELQRSGEREEKISSILATIRRGPIRFDTECLSITLDPKCGTASGIILRGQYTGQMIESLDVKTVELMRDKAPDQETRLAIEAWLSR
jgi:hypothetical protein